jgi:protein-disulfide isomerase
MVLFLMAGALGDEFAPQALVAAFLLAIAGLIGSVALAIVLLAGWAPFCPLCMVVHGINLLLAPAMKARLGRSWRRIIGDVVSASRSLLQKPDERSPVWRWRITGFAAAALAALVLYQGVFIVCERWVYESRGIFNPHKLLAAFAAAPKIDLPAGPDDPRRGPVNASVQVVVFSSFHCPACRQFSREINILMERFPGQVSLVFKQFPLAAPCNPIARRGSGESGACETAYASMAARKQGKFWEFHDMLYRNHFPPERGAIMEVAQEVGLDISRFNADRESEQVRAAVREDIELGVRLDINETPTVFINKRRLRGAGARALEVIIADIVKERAR